MLSDKEPAELLTAGKCFICRETGHMSRNCPSRHTVRVEGTKPPGTLMYHIEPVEQDQWSEGSVDVLDSLPLGTMFLKNSSSGPLDMVRKWVYFTAPILFGPLSRWRDHYQQWKQAGVWAQHQIFFIGDCYALVADELITLAQPFPDEQFNDSNLQPELQFKIERSKDSPEYLIQNYLTLKPIIIAKSLLERPRFNIGRWYARRRAPYDCLPKEAYAQTEMGHALLIVATKLLAEGVQTYYPSINNMDKEPEAWFSIRPPRNKHEDYVVNDFGYLTPLPQSWLEMPEFNIIRWHMQQLVWQKWEEQHEDEINSIPEPAGDCGRCLDDHHHDECFGI